MKIISGLSNPALASKIANEINADLLSTKIDNFSDGELRVQVDGIIGQDLIIVQSTSTPANDHLMELLLLADTAKRAGAKNIIAVIPYFGYSRQDRCTYKNGPISASVVIKMIESAGISHVITLDLHSAQLEGVFNIPITNLSTESIFFHIYENRKNTIIVSPDIGGISRARNYSSLFGTDLAIINKTRDQNNICSMSEVIGEVKGKHCIIVDDIIDGASTLCMAAELLIKKGAESVDAIITHAVLSRESHARVENSKVNKIYITDSIYQKKLSDKFITLPIHELIGRVINNHKL
jgi:ribose-phosphate pyrophosphokinase